MKRRITSIVLALCLTLGLLPVNARAADEDGTEIVNSVFALAYALNHNGEGPEVEADIDNKTVTLKGDVTLSQVLQINCEEVTINLNGHPISLSDHACIQVNSGANVRIIGSAEHCSITSSDESFAIVAMRGSKLTIEGAAVQGIFLSDMPSGGTGKLQTELNIIKAANITGRDGSPAIYVSESIKDTQEGNYPVLNLNGVEIHNGIALAGMAKTTITCAAYNSTRIDGTPGIMIGAGSLTVGDHVTVEGTADGGTDGHGSAIRVENNPYYAGNVNVTISKGAALRSADSYAICEVRTGTGAAAAPKITVEKGASLISGSAVDAAVRVESAQVFNNNLTVTFNCQSGAFSDGSSSVIRPTDAAGKVTGWPADPSQDGHIFQGWFTEKAGGAERNSGYGFTEDTTVYAQWKEKPPANITFHGNNGTPKSQTITAGTDGKLEKQPEEPARDGYIFDGWFTKASGGEAVKLDGTFAASTTVYAHWTAKPTYKVTFDGSGGEPGSQKLTTDWEGKLKSKPKAPGRTGYTFDGWFFSEDGDGDELDLNSGYAFQADTTVYARWTAKPTYKVTFDGNGGEPEIQEQTTDWEGKLTEKPDDPRRSGFFFNGWFFGEDGGDRLDLNKGYTFGADTTVYAQWVDPFELIGPYTVTFNANGGSGAATLKTGTDGRLSALPKDPVRTGYTFDGWYFDVPNDHLKVYTSTVFRADTTVYARWTQNPGSSANPNDPVNPGNPTNPGTPSGGSHLIGTPGNVYGGSYSVSHTAAAAGTLVTIQVSPWSNYTLGSLSVIRTDVNQNVYVYGYGNQYTFTMPDSDVRLAITYSLSYNSGGSAAGQPAAGGRYVDWYYSGGNTYHVSSGLVPSGSALTRDMFIAILYNLDGGGSREREPAIWAAANNVVPDVVMSELWGTDRAITREQAAMILYGYARYKGYDTSRTMSLSGYRDAGQIRSMAVPAVSWCCAAGLITGTSSTTLSPLGTLTCGQANIIISRFLSGVVR